MPTTTKERTKIDVYDLITQQFIDALEDDVIPWRRTWTRGLPKNCKWQVNLPIPLKLCLPIGWKVLLPTRWKTVLPIGMV